MKIEIIIDKTIQPQLEKDILNESNPTDIVSISNIFGGAEVLE